jgi:hypothetical protein
MSKSKKGKNKSPDMDTTEAITNPSWGLSLPTIGFGLTKSKGTGTSKSTGKGKPEISITPTLSGSLTIPLMDTTEATAKPSKSFLGLGSSGGLSTGTLGTGFGFFGPKGDKGPEGDKGKKSDKKPSSSWSGFFGPKGDKGSEGEKGDKGHEGDKKPSSSWSGFFGPKGDKGKSKSKGTTSGPLSEVASIGDTSPGAPLTSTASTDPIQFTDESFVDRCIIFLFKNPSGLSFAKAFNSNIIIFIVVLLIIISIILIALQKYSGLLDFLIVAYILFACYYLYNQDLTTFTTLSVIMLIIIIIIISVFSNELTKFVTPLFIFSSFMFLIAFPLFILWGMALYKYGYRLIKNSTFITVSNILFTIEIISILIILFMYKQFSYFLLLLSTFVSIAFVLMNDFSVYSFLIIFLIIMLILILAKCDLSLKTLYTKTDQKIVNDVFIILFFVILIVLIIVFLSFKSFNELKTSTKEDNFASAGKLFNQIFNVFYIIFYTICLITFFTLMPSDIVNTYSKVILPITILLGAGAFYKSYQSYNKNDEFNIKYDRIKTIILLFCLITNYIIFYNIDPGGYIDQYFGSVSLIAVIIAVFAFLYLIIIFTLSNETETGKKSTNLLSGFNKTSSIGGLLFLLFIIAITITITYYPNGFFSDSNKTTIAGPSIIIILLICIFWSIMLIHNLFSDKTNTSSATKTVTKLSLFQKSLMVLFAIVIGVLSIVWIVYNLQNLSSSSGIFSFILNIIIMLIVVNLIYKTIYVKIPDQKISEKKNAFFSLIINTIFYIPCLVGDLFEGGSNMLFSVGKLGTSNAKTSELTKVTPGSVMMLIGAILLIIGYFAFPVIINKVNLQGGRLLVDNPVYTNTPYLLGTYEELNGSTNYDYQYAISFWFFLDSTQQTGGTAYASLLNFGNKPNVLYREDNNTLLITMEDAESKTNKNPNSINDYDSDNKRILYKNKNTLLQKWNNIIINYSGGIMDIFLNNELVKSNVGVVPYYTIDNLTIGQDDGIKGGICNVVYYTHPLNKTNMYFLYNMVKDKNPPVLNQSNETILKQDWKIASTAVTSVSTPAINQTSTSISNTDTNISNEIKT